jgi:methylmalonyl-CoA/ethylmalonyl-CoA epimerase
MTGEISEGQEKLPQGKPGFAEVAQVGVVVRDLDRVIAVLSGIFGMGPFRVITYPPEGRGDMNRVYRGEPGDFTYRQAFVDLGTVELEIIQPISGRSVWSDFLEKHGEGIHHIRFNTYDMSEVVAYLAAQGISVGMSGNGLRPGTCWANFDTEDRVGFTVEIMQAVRGTSGRTPAIVDGRVVAA